MVGSMLQDKIVNKFEMKRLEVPCVWHKFNSIKAAPRLMRRDLENNRVLASSSNNHELKRFG